jgi:hypothetical protein
MSQISLEVVLLVILVCAVYLSQRQQIIVIPSEQGQGQGHMQMQMQMQQRGGDDRYTMAPRPQREWQTRYEVPIRGALDPVATRGPPESYQQMGIVDSGDGKLLPLYGRRVAPRSDFFNYYTRTDTYNPVAVPVQFKRRNCQDNVGCAEVSNGDEIDLGPLGQKAKVTLYGFDGPRYAP